MNKLYTLIFILLCLIGNTACTDESQVQDGRGTILPNGDILLEAGVDTRGVPVVATRDIDPDGLVINNLWLLCFDESIYKDESTGQVYTHYSYLGRREAAFNGPDENGNYNFRVGVPQNTRVIHFIANLDLENFNAPVGIDEATLVPSLESASGRMTYWGRTKFSSQMELEEFAKNGRISLFCNQAKVSYTVEAQEVEVLGFALCNRRAWGTVAPFDSQTGKFDFDLEHKRYITNPCEEHLTLSPDPTEVSTAEAQYIFEDPNSQNEPIYAVMKIKTATDDGKFYKIMLVDADKNTLPIYRNMEYRITIKGIPTQFGYATFDEAKNGTVANNVWVSIDLEVPELSDGINMLDIPGGTTYIYTEGGEKTIDFSYDGNGDVNVSWLINDGTVSVVTPQYEPKGEGKYTIKLKLAHPLEQAAKAVLLLRVGQFTREIQVYLMKPLEFKPVWATTGVPQKVGELIAMTFVIPDSYPDELLPITCKIATNRLNPIDTLEAHYSVISEKCDFQITHNAGTSLETTDIHSTEWGYKYVYTAAHKGEQELFFRMNSSVGNDMPGTVSNCKEPEGLLHTHIFLQADYFKDEEYIVHFQEASESGEIRLIRFEGETDDVNNQDVKGYLEVEIPPTVNQEVIAPFYVEGGSIVTGTYMRISTSALHLQYENGELPEGVVFVGSVRNGAAIDYWVQFTEEVPAGVDKKKEFKFKTHTPRVDDSIRFFIDGGDTEHSNKDDKNWFKSGMVKVIAVPGTFNFGLTMEQEVIKYGIGQKVVLNFEIPKSAVQYTDLTLYLLTRNLKPDPSDSHAGHLEPLENGEGYRLNIPQGTEQVGNAGQLSFLTTRIASAETVTLCTADDTQALFNPFIGSFSNRPVEGYIRLGDGTLLNRNSFIALERKNGTRVGVFHLTSEGSLVGYELTVRPEYDFTMDELLTVHYHNDGIIYQTTVTFNELLNGGNELILEQR